MFKRLPFTALELLLIALQVLNLHYYLDAGEVSSLYAIIFLGAIGYASSFFGYQALLFKICTFFLLLIEVIAVTKLGFTQNIVMGFGALAISGAAGLGLALITYSYRLDDSDEDLEDDDED